MVQHTPWAVIGGPVRPTPPVRGRCPEGAEGVGITGPYKKKNGRAEAYTRAATWGRPYEILYPFRGAFPPGEFQIKRRPQAAPKP